MRLRRRASPLLLLLIPTLASVLTLVPRQELDVLAVAENVEDDAAAAEIIAVAPSKPAVKGDVPTKDAPVDGRDGKPHAGPWVPSEADKERKLSVKSEDLEIPKSAKRPDLKGIPKSNDGVMDDKNRQTARKGPTGTEGGITEKTIGKDRDNDVVEKKEKKPVSPEEALPLSHIEQEEVDPDSTTKVKSGKTKDRMMDGDTEMEKPKGAAGIEKPTDLPSKPHTLPKSEAPKVPKTGPLTDDEPGHKTSSSKHNDHEGEESDDDDSGIIQPLHSFILSLTMILFSEVGDKTFLVAALMAMRHPRLVVFSAAFSALIAMTVLSAVLGHAVPTLLPKRFTNFAAAILFLVFGAKMLKEGFAMDPEEGVGEEMKEVEMELEEKEQLAIKQGRRRSSISPYALESGRVRRSRSNSRLPLPPRSPSESPSRSPSPSRSSVSNVLSGLNNLLSLLLSPAWVQTFIMTFLGEWGDRSQIATIAMAAGQDYWWVTGGAISGHAVCTGVAVIGGRAIAGRVSMRKVTLGGAFAFLAFGIIYSFEALYSE